MLLVLFTLSAMLLKGAQADWSVIFMRDEFAAEPFVSGIAFALGALTQGVSRYFADRFDERFGPFAVARGMIAILAVGVVLVTFSPAVPAALIGFGLMGIGTSGIFPLAIPVAAQHTDRPAALNVAAVAPLSFAVFLIGPPLLGFVAEHFGIRLSFGIGIPLVVLSWFMAFSLRQNAAGRRA